MARDHVGTGLPASLVWSYDEPRERLVELYEQAKAAQWNAATDIDWSIDVDPGTGPVFATAAGAIDWATLGDPVTAALGTGPEVVREILTQHHAWFISQFLHGEQGSLVAMAKVCAAAESVEAKACAAVLMADEARHVEVFRRYLDKIGLSYPVTPAVRQLLMQAIGHRSADLTFVGTQILLENLALAVAGLGGSVFGNPLLCQIVGRVRQDEARHLEFGAAALDGLYADMDPVERREREDFVLEAAALLRTQFCPVEVWERLGIDVAAAQACFADSPDVAAVHALVFARIVPDLGRMGLLTPRVQQGLETMGVLHFRRCDSIPRVSRVERLGVPRDREEASRPAGVRARQDGDVELAGLAATEAGDPLLALRAALGCVEQIEPEPVLLAMSGLLAQTRVAGVPKATVRLAVAAPSGSDEWLVTVGDAGMSYRQARPAEPADVAVSMDLATWTEMVAGRVTMPAALAGGRIRVTGDIFKARALEAVL
jgi:hypothetical protein